MRKVTLLGALAAGAWAGWRAARSNAANLLAPRPEPSPARSLLVPTAALEALRSKELSGSTAQAVEKLVALLELGRERGLEVVQSVLGGRTGNAA